MNIAHHLTQAAQRFPEQTALIFADQRWSYAQLESESAAVAANLKTLGIFAGDRVALYLPNVPQFVQSYYALQRLGAIAVTLSALLKKREIAHEVNDCGARILITASTLLENVPTQAELPSVEHLIVVGGSRREHRPFASLLEVAPLPDVCSMDADDGATILYTSGTTGYPKGAVLTHGNVISNVAATVHYSGVTPEDRLLCFLPLFHCFGQNFIMNTCFASGATLVLHTKFEAEEILRSIQVNEVTMFFAVPTVYKRLYDAKLPPEAFRTVRYYFSAAAKMPESLPERWQTRYGLPIHEGYGLTECSPFACYNHENRWVAGSVGTPITDVEMKVVDLESGVPLVPKAVGEICIKGPNVMRGYWNATQATAQVIDAEGWLHSGDVGYVDEDGYYFIVDRVKEMINPGGFTVSPSEIEDVLCEHPKVADACVVGVPHDDLGEAIKAFVVAEGVLSAEEVLKFCHQEMAKHKVPHFVEFVEEIPTSPTGKKLRRLLKDR